MCFGNTKTAGYFLLTTYDACKEIKKKKVASHLAGLEPATFRLTAERANRLRHKCQPQT